MNRVESLLAPHAIALSTLVIAGTWKQERHDEISAGTAKITGAEAKAIAEATNGVVSAELLLQLNKDDLASGRKKSPKTPSSKSPSVKIGPYGPKQAEW